MRKFIRYITGLSHVSSRDVGRILLYLVAFVPLIYKFISPFFILAGLSNLTVIIMPTFVIFGTIMAWRDLIHAIRIQDVAFYILIVATLALSPVIRINTLTFFDDNYINFIFTVLPFFFVGLLIDFDIDGTILRFVARMGILVQIFWQVCILAGFVTTEMGTSDSVGEQMEVAYQLLFPVFYLYVTLSKSFNSFDLILSIIGTILMFFMGARGPIVVYALFLVGYLIFFHSYRKYAFFKKSLVVVCFIAFIVNLKVILKAIIPMAKGLRFSTRVFDSILANQMVNLNASSQRDSFYARVINVIVKDDSGFGYGWGADRLFTPDGLYVHNFELEVLCQFGVIGGGLLLLALIILLLKSYIISKTQNQLPYWYTMLCSGWLALQFSYSYILYPMFFVFVGCMVSCCRKR